MKLKLAKTVQEQKFNPFTIEIESDEFDYSKEKLEAVYMELDSFMRGKINERRKLIQAGAELPEGW